MKKVYIASAYTKGDTAVNVKRQFDTANKLINYGFAPFCPLLFHFQQMAQPRSEEDWIKLDNLWVLNCNMVLRLPGESSGADMECQLARDNNIPVYHDIKQIITEYENP